MRSLRDRDYWQRQIRSGRLQLVRGEDLVASFRDGIDGVDSDILAEVSLRAIELAVMELERRGHGLPCSSSPEPTMHLDYQDAHGAGEDLASELALCLLRVIRNPGHQWFEEAAVDFFAVVRALIRKVRRSVDGANEKHRVTRSELRDGRLVKVRPVERRIVTVDAEELERRSDASVFDDRASEMSEREVHEEVLERAAALARDDLDRRIAILVLKGCDADDIAVELGISVDEVRRRVKNMRRRMLRARRVHVAPLCEGLAFGDGSRRVGDKQNLDEGGEDVPPLRAAE